LGGEEGQGGCPREGLGKGLEEFGKGAQQITYSFPRIGGLLNWHF